MRALTMLGAAALCATLLAGSGCRPFEIKTPSGFVELEKTRRPYKAVSAEGAVLQVRTFKNRPKADLAFWSKVVSDELTDQRGYKLKKSEAVKSANGLAGKRQRWDGELRGEPYVYDLSLFVTDARIFVVEAAAPRKDYKRYRAAADALLGSFRPDR